MSNILQVIEKKGHLLENNEPYLVPAGRTVRIHPMLFAPSSKISDCVVGDPDFLVGDKPPLAPTSVNLSSGFELEEIITDTTSPNFGCFLAQNVTDHPQELWWQAVCDLSLQQRLKPYTPTADLLQLGAGENGEFRGSAFGVNPAAIQGTAIPFPFLDTAFPVLTVEEVNNKLIGLSANVTSVQLPQMQANQHGMEVTFKNLCIPSPANMPTIAAFAGQTIEGAATWQFPNPTAGPGGIGFGFAVTFVFDINGGASGNWRIKAHYHKYIFIPPR